MIETKWKWKWKFPDEDCNKISCNPHQNGKYLSLVRRTMYVLSVSRKNFMEEFVYIQYIANLSLTELPDRTERRSNQGPRCSLLGLSVFES